jgi:KUP system potassium uptake protein
MAVASSGEVASSSRVAQRITPAAALTALGIVYGDLGTSPLYTMQTVVQAVGGEFTPDTALGVLSLIFWALIITISVKYCLFVMRADNHGEGGILALMSMIGANKLDRGRTLTYMGLFGAALIYGDGAITPAISVLSAVEGVKASAPLLTPYVLPAAVIILLALFAVQPRGTSRIGHVFGPVMLIWFGVIGLLGIAAIVRHPVVIAAVDPRYALSLLAHGRWSDFAVLGGVFLALTGAEALYADMGHIGRGPIRMSWYGIVLPALLLNYAGQTALLLEQSHVDGNPFFLLAPSWSIGPLVLLATVATIIASQAIITGAFSMTRQAMQLGWFPGVRIRQTSAEEYGQIYVPFINWVMMAMTIALTISFGSSDRLAGAYGTAVSTTMLLTTALLYRAMRDRWGWSLATALSAGMVFLAVDFAFFSANLMKILEGGWVPLVFSALMFTIMTTWRFGTEAVRRKLMTMTEPADKFLRRIREDKIPRVPGTAVFLTKTLEATPPLIVRHVAQMGALHKTLIALTVRFEDVPRIKAQGRLQMQQLFDGFWRITVHYGFIEVPDLPAALRQAKDLGCPVDLEQAIYFAAGDNVVRSKRGAQLSRWRVPLFAFMFRNAVHAADLFKLPARNFLEIGRQIEI